LPSDVAAGLARELDGVRATADAHLDLSLDVTERWEWDGGEGIEIGYRLSSDGTGGAAVADDSGTAAPRLWVDTSGHLAETITTCRACGTTGCSACSAMPGPCSVCSWVFCGNCMAADAPRRCEAC